MHDDRSETLRQWLLELGAVDEDTSAAELKSLKRLDLSNKSIDTLPEEFGELQALTALNLANNRLSDLPESFGTLKHLVNLNLRRNNFTAIPGQFRTLSLKSLNLNANKITDIDRINGCSTLHVLDLSANAINKVENCFNELEHLRNLNLSFNYISDISQLSEGLVRLERLNVSNNLLTRLPATLAAIEELRVLEASENRITAYDEMIETMELEVLDLTSNTLTSLHLKGFDALESLTIDDNPLGQLSFDAGFAPGLQEFSCEDCGLDVMALPPADTLKVLSYSFNAITEVNPDIGRYKGLKELGLDHNAIVSLPDVFTTFGELNTFYIDGNPLSAESATFVRSLDLLNCDLSIKTDVAIRKAQFDDLHVMARLLSQLFAIESDFQADFAKQYNGLKLLFDANNADILVAKHKNKVVGMITMQRLISTSEGSYVGWIEDLIIDEEYRKMGVGKSMMRTIMDLAHQRGYARIQLAADKENAKALYFYQKRGFRKTNLNIYRYIDPTLY